MVDTAQRRPPAALIDLPAHTSAHTAAGASGWLRALPPAVRFVLQGRAGVWAAASPVWGVGFSDEPCRAMVADQRATLWLGPDEYLLLDMAGDAGVVTAAANIETALERALTGIPHSLVDVSHRQIALQLRGPHAATILNGACPLDLDLAEFPIGMCTRTVFAKADIVLWRTERDTFHVEVWRSFAAYVTGLMYEIAREFEPETDQGIPVEVPAVKI
jgi:sarcosine oxidase subunit gamma